MQEAHHLVSKTTHRLPLITFTYWIDGRTLHVLADAVDEDADDEYVAHYEWSWGDGHTTTGEAFTSHEYARGIEQAIVTLVRLDGDGRPTHEGAEWIDIVFYEYHGEADGPPSPARVIALDHDTRRAGTESDIAAFVKSVPAPPLLPLLALMLLFLGRRRD